MKIQWQRTTKIDRKQAKKPDGSKPSDSPAKKNGAGGNDASVVSNA